LAAAVAVLAGVLIFFSWNILRGPLESQITARLGRAFEINGDLDVDLSLAPRITIERATLANPAWGSRPAMATVDRIEVVVDLRRLLQGEIVLPEVSIAKPDVLLETRPDQPPNWQFGAAEIAQGPPSLPRIGRLEVDDASIRYHDFGSGRDVAARLTRIFGSTDGGVKLNATGTAWGKPPDAEVIGAPPGQVLGIPIVFDLQAGGKGAQGPGAHPIEARIEALNTRVTASGGIAELEQLRGLDLRIEMTSPDATEILSRLDIDLGLLPPIQAAGHVVGGDDLWELDAARVEVGESNVAGRVRLDLSGPRAFISAELESAQFRARDLGAAPAEQSQPAGAEAAATEAGRAAARSAPLLTATGINFEALPQIDADVTFRGRDIEVPEVRLAQLDLDFKLRHGVAVIDLTGDGTYRERQAVTFEAHAGTEENLENPASRYPVDVSLDLGDSRVTATGTVDQPLNYTGLDVAFALQGPDLEELGEALKLPLPATPPYDLAGKITHQDQEKRWNFVALRGTVGDTDIQGDVSLELSSDPPTVVADLRSGTLDLDDLGVLIGAPPGTGPGETASSEQRRQAAQEAAAKAPLLPDERFDVPALRAVDARVSFAAERVQAMGVPLERLDAKLTLEAGRLRVEPARVGLAGGEVEAGIDMGSGGGTLDGDLALTLRNIQLDQLLSSFEIDLGAIDMKKEAGGTLGGQAKLTIAGNSIREMAAAADGELAVIMSGGQINVLVIEALGLDVGEILGVLLAGAEEKEADMVPVQCLVSRFEVQDGVMTTRALVLETSDSTITGAGTVDFGKETLDLRLLAHPKDASVLTASTPVAIKGTFRDPTIDVVSEELEEKGLAALALGVVLPVIGAILPFIETGEAEGVNCAALIKEAETGGVPQGTPNAEQ
jgi:hypothetical protein